MTGSATHPASYSMGNEVLSQTQSGREIKLTAYLNLVLKLIMSGAIPLLPLYAFQASTGKTMATFLQSFDVLLTVHLSIILVIKP